ncbi:hypothetical protein Dsin_013140 [Dipteronia sinensis]|uniref:Uncharacterized protein n=1 Tax=Dipteronia sinensis TaxID=43782 RepID=A0AAE0AK78_9ROSI|nr:hypothetical protein Dsin_013140 [Dipteronia sinensis]
MVWILPTNPNPNSPYSSVAASSVPFSHNTAVRTRIGFDGIRMLDPNTSMTLRIFPLQNMNITRCQEMGGSTRPSESLKTDEQLSEKKKGLTDWMNIKPGNEEKDQWVPDEAVTKCTTSGTDFGAFVRKVCLAQLVIDFFLCFCTASLLELW